jgi:methyltransferase
MNLTQSLFLAIVGSVIGQRLVELRISKQNEAYILAHGGRKHGDNYLPWVKLLQISWFISMLAEVWLLDRPFLLWLAIPAMISVMAGQVLRYLSMQALDWRWTLPIMTVPEIAAVDSGIYRYLPHPNWIGVTLEIAALPLIHGAYLTAISFSLVNAFLMIKRMQSEENALHEQSFSTTESINFVNLNEDLSNVTN